MTGAENIEPTTSMATVTADDGGEPPSLTDTDIIALAQSLHLHRHQQPPPSSRLPLQLSSPRQHAALVSYLKSRSADSPNASLAVSDYMFSLLSLISLSPQNPDVSHLLSSLLLSYVDLFVSHQIPHDPNSLKTIQFFGTLLDFLEIGDVQSAVESIVSSFPKLVTLDDAQLLDLLPRCLSLIQISNEFGQGGEYVSSVMDRVLDCSWSTGLLLKLVSLLREFAFLDKLRGREFLEKVFQGMAGVDLQELPSLVYQLLVLASKGLCKREVVEGIVMFFKSELGLKRGASILRQVEGTVLLHINFAVKQDPSLGKEIMGLIKSDFQAFNHFAVAVMLSISRIKRFSEKSLEILKKAILTSYWDYKFAEDCKWLPDELRKEFLQSFKLVEKAVLKAVNETTCGREHMVPSILQLAFLLLESVREGNHKKTCSSDDSSCIEGIGIQMLKNLFEVHDMSRSEIIEQCKYRILSLKPEQSMPIIRLLGQLIRNYPYPIMEHVSRLKELLDYFTYMNGEVASHLVTSLLPLIKFSRDLLDYIILVVRKALFRREDTVLLAAACAIFDVILMDKQSYSNLPFQDSSSQASCSQQAEDFSCLGGALRQELVGLLQRCLYLQAKVKRTMYCGLLRLVLMDPSIARLVLDLLLPHFLRFYKEDSEGQFYLTSCVGSESGNVFIEEPLDSLLSCVAWILILQPLGKTGRSSDNSWTCFGFSLSQDEAGRNLSLDSFSSILLKIRKLLRAGKMEVILGQKDDSGSGSSDKEKTKCCAIILSGIAEVVLNIVATEMENTIDAKKADLEKELIDCVELLFSLEKYMGKSRQSQGIRRANVRSRAHNDTPDRTSSGSITFTQEQIPFFATSTINQLLHTAVGLLHSGVSNAGASSNHSQSSFGKNRNCCSNLIAFVLDILFRHVKSYPALGRDDLLKTFIHGDIKVLGPPLLKLILMLKSGPLSVPDENKKAGTGRNGNFHQAFICFREMLMIYSECPEFTVLLEDMVSIFTSEHGCDGENDITYATDDPRMKIMELFIVNFLKPMLSELLLLPSCHEVEVLCDIILMTANKLPCQLRNSHGSWATDICKSICIKDSKVARSVVMLAVQLSSPPNDLILAQDVATELSKLAGSECDYPAETSESYPIVNKYTSIMLVSCILQSVEAVISDMDWATKKLKPLFFANQKRINFNEKQLPLDMKLAFEENLFSRAEQVVKVLSSFALMSLKDSLAEHFLRLLTRLYKQLAQMSKLQIAPRGSKQIPPGIRFQKLVELTCKQLTVPLYNFVAEMQKDQQENANKRGMMGMIKRENRCIPELIFQIEDYERYLIQLSKVTKVNLLRHAKRSTARDFKILEPTGISGEGENPINEPSHPHSVEQETESCNESEQNEGDTEGNAVSPKSGSCSSADESGSDGEEANAPLPNKRMRARGTAVVHDSDDED